MSFRYGGRKRKTETTTTLVSEPQVKKRKFLYGKQRKLQLQHSLATSTEPNTFANSFRQELINKQLGLEIETMADHKDQSQNNNSNNKEEINEIEILPEDEAVQERKKITGPEENRIAAVLGRYKVISVIKLREKAAKLALKADDAQSALTKKDAKAVKNIINSSGSLEEACRIAPNDDKLGAKIHAYFIRKSAELSAVEAISTCEEIEAIMVLKRTIASKEEKEKAEKSIAEEELRQVCLAIY